MLGLVPVLAALMQRTTTRTSSNVDSGAAVAFLLVYFAIMIVFYVFYSWCLSKIFTKAGITPWWAWVPLVNTYGLWKLTGRDMIWLILLFVPCMSYVAIFVIMIDVAKSFGKSTGYGVGLALLSPVFLPMLAFDKGPYLGPAQQLNQQQFGYGQAAPYGQAGYGQPAYGQPPYPQQQPGYDQPPYGQQQPGYEQQPPYGQGPPQ